MPLVVNSQIQIPDEELRFTYARSGGPGGQNVNKVNSKAVLHWQAMTSPALNQEVRERFLKLHASKLTTEGEVVITSTRYRDQGKNVDDCLEKLKEMIVAATIRPRVRRKTRPSKGSKERRLAAKSENSQRKRGRQSPTLE